MKSNKHIVLLTPGFAENESDENCIPPIQSFLLTFKEQHPETSFSVISFQYPFFQKPYLWNGIEVYPVGGKNKKGLSRIITWWNVLVCFLKIRSNHKRLVLHCLWLTECYFIGRLFSKIFRIKLIATVMGQDAKKENRYLKFARNTDATIVACSRFAAHTLLEAHGIVTKAIIPFGIYEKEYFTDPDTARTIDVIGVGNLGPIKQYAVFIKIIAELKPFYPNINCEIVGEGEYKNELSDQIRNEGLSKNIVLTGSLPRKEVLNKMAKAKILLHTSSYEGQGYVYMEALASGAYIVSFDTGHLPANPKTSVCQTASGMTETIIALLKSNLSFTPKIPMTMRETVTAYSKHYQS